MIGAFGCHVNASGRRIFTSLLCAAVLLGAGTAPAAAADGPIGVHSMLQLSFPRSFMESMFAEAAAMHASAVRLDVAPALVFGNLAKPPDFSGLDAIVALARQYHLRVVADLLTIPWWIASCQAPTDIAQMDRCGTDNLAEYRSMVARIVARASPVIRDWEVWNEPDLSAFFTGTPVQYAQMLRAAHDAIKQVDPEADVLLGGISGTSGQSWLSQVLAAPGADAVHAFDTANVHERGPLDSLAGDIAGWRRFLAANGFNGPLWVSEHGYPSDSAYQYDPAYAGGAASQAAYLTASIPTLLDAGAAEVLVTERDNLGGQFASEGVLGGNVLDPGVENPEVVEKSSYAAIRALAACYGALARACPGAPPAAAPPSVSLLAGIGTSTTATVTVSDPGAGPLQLGAASLAGPAAGAISLSADACSNRLLEPDHTCELALRFEPVAPGQSSAVLELPSDNGPLVVAVTVGAALLPTAAATRVEATAPAPPGRHAAPQRAVAHKHRAARRRHPCRRPRSPRRASSHNARCKRRSEEA